MSTSTIDEEILQLKKDIGLLTVIVHKLVSIHDKEHTRTNTDTDHTKQEKELLRELRDRLLSQS